jgi:lysophospholipase L1-like esterase
MTGGPDSPYAIADTPVSIILMTPGPLLPSMYDPATDKAEWCLPGRMKLFRDAVLAVGAEWKAKAKLRDAELDQGVMGWAVETLDVWGDLVAVAGGAGEELRPFMTCVLLPILWAVRWLDDSDGLHFSDQGYQIIFEGISKIVRKEFKGRGVDFTNLEDLPLKVPL